MNWRNCTGWVLVCQHPSAAYRDQALTSNDVDGDSLIIFPSREAAEKFAGSNGLEGTFLPAEVHLSE